MIKTHDYPFATTWSLKKIFFWSFLSALLMASWIWPATRALWDAFDQFSFLSLNSSIAWGKPFAVFWAFTGDPRFDLAIGMIILLVFAYYLSKREPSEIARALALCCVTVVAFLIVIILQREIVSWPRESPAMVIQGRHSIQEIVPWSHAKEISGHSFPGDHATVMIIITILFWRAFGASVGWTMFFLGIVFSLPRLVAGGHWMTDDIIGGGTMGLLVLAFMDGMPLGWWLYQKAYPWAVKAQGKIGFLRKP